MGDISPGQSRLQSAWSFVKSNALLVTLLLAYIFILTLEPGPFSAWFAHFRSLSSPTYSKEFIGFFQLAGTMAATFWVVTLALMTLWKPSSKPPSPYRMVADFEGVQKRFFIVWLVFQAALIGTCFENAALLSLLALLPGVTSVAFSLIIQPLLILTVLVLFAVMENLRSAQSRARSSMQRAEDTMRRLESGWAEIRHGIVAFRSRAPDSDDREGARKELLNLERKARKLEKPIKLLGVRMRLIRKLQRSDTSRAVNSTFSKGLQAAAVASTVIIFSTLTLYVTPILVAIGVVLLMAVGILTTLRVAFLLVAEGVD